MYDRVKLWVDRYDVGEQYTHIATYLDDAKEQTDLKTGEVRTFGMLHNLRVNLYPLGISIVGSLPKFLYQSNIYPLDRHSTDEAILKIADALHLSLSDAKVTGLEFGTNFLMRQRVNNYLDRLGDMPRMQRYRFNQESLYYKHKGKQQPKTFCYYDKIAEAKKEKMEIPPGLQEQNILRCEIRLNGRLPYQMNMPEVTASTLSDRTFYKMMMKRFVDAYFSILKLSKSNTKYMGDIKTVADAYDVFVAKLLSQTGQSQEAIDDFMKDLKAARVFTNRGDYGRLRKRIERATSKGSLAQTDDLIKELDDEFRNIEAYM